MKQKTFADRKTVAEYCPMNIQIQILVVCDKKKTYSDTQPLNYFVVLAISMSLWMLQITSDMVPHQYKNHTVSTEEGAESVELPCGEDTEKEVAIYWYMFKHNQWRNILKLFPTKPRKNITYYTGYTSDKYGVSKSVNTSLVIRNIDCSDTGLFRCESGGGQSTYSYTTLLKVLGKF